MIGLARTRPLVEVNPEATVPKNPDAKTVGILGASGFAGAELLRLVAEHPNFELKVATASSKAGSSIAGLYPHLAGEYPKRVFDHYTPEAFKGIDLVFCALPHGESMKVVPELLELAEIVIDLGSDFRLSDASLYPQWYNADHSAPEFLTQAAYGLPELFRQEIQQSRLVAATGCNAAASILTLAPLLEAGLISETGLVVNLLTGVSGAGRPPKENTTFCAVDENVTAYALTSHRHTPEIEQALTRASGKKASVLFTPHLVPMSRGVMATTYSQPHAGVSSADLTTETVLEAMAKFYENEPFIVVDEAVPATKSVAGSNMVHLTARVDSRTGQVLAIGVLDNLVKGAAGMAIQCANICTEQFETTGLSRMGLYP